MKIRSNSAPLFPSLHQVDSDTPQTCSIETAPEAAPSQAASRQEKFTPPLIAHALQQAGTTGPDAKAIGDALNASIEDKDSHILVVGYSPTGGGHTARLLNIVHAAIDSDKLTQGSTVILHVPEKWQSQARPAALSDLAKALLEHGVHVIGAEADKSVYGFLDQKTGHSDDAAILDKFAHYATRDTLGRKTSLTACKIYRNPDDFQTLPKISARHLMRSLAAIIGDEAIYTKVKILTDMDPYLQKAAKNQGVPGENRLDQQNHAILLNPDHPNSAANFVPVNALLAKVLGGTGERVSHIGLGEKNTLSEMNKVVDLIKLKPESTKKEALTAVSEHLIKHAIVAHPVQTGNTEGIFRHQSIQSGTDVKNLVYVYAHANTNKIAAHVRAQVEKNTPGYTETLFLFCGAKAVKGANAMHLAYLAEGDGITTAGAGTNGEFSYLHKKADSGASLMVLPIAGHNEQEANANALGLGNATKKFVTRRAATDDLGQALDTFVMDQALEAKTKYALGNLSSMLNAVNDDSTYVAQAHDLLFGARDSGHPSAETHTGANIRKMEAYMRNDIVLKANRKFAKVVFQALRQLESTPHGNADRLIQPIGIALTAKPEDRLQFKNLNDFIDHLDNDNLLEKKLRSTVQLGIDNLVLLSETRNAFHDIRVKLGLGADPKHIIAELKGKFGDRLTTGF